MKRAARKHADVKRRNETLTEAYEVRAFRDDSAEILVREEPAPEIPHAAPGAFQAVKSRIPGRGEQLVIPDECQFGDNDLCYVDA